MSRSGILSFDRADAIVEITEWVEVPKKNLTVENATTVSPNISSETGGQNSSAESNDNTDDGGNGNASNPTAEVQGSADLGIEKKLKKRTFRVPLKV